MHFKELLRINSFIFVSSALSFALLCSILLFINVGFSSFRNSDFFAPFWLLITNTGRIPSVAVILILTFFYLKYHFRKFSRSQKDLYKFFALIIVFQISVAALTSFVLKNFFQNPRPVQLFLTEQGLISDKIDFFEMKSDKSETYLSQTPDSTKEAFKNIYPPVIDEWASVSVYSFPSGHASSSFYIAVILSFIMFKTGSHKIISLIPFAWAILVSLSRVIIGVHFKIDVIAGAFLGMISGLILISFEKVNGMFSQKN